MTTLDAISTLEVTSCCVCGVEFALPKIVIEARRKVAGQGFYCPNGHTLSFTETELQRAQKEAVRLREQFFSEQRAHEETTRTLKKIQKRVARGVCPCCQRSFVNMQRHMRSKHADFVAGKEA